MKKPTQKSQEAMLALFEERRGVFAEEVKNLQFTYIEEEPVVCKHFSCPRILTPQERLLSQFCINHNPANYPSL